MHRSASLALAALLAATPARAVDFEITDPVSVALVIAVSDAVDAATEKIGGCRAAGGNQAGCLCENAGDIARIRTVLGEALAMHPEWEGKSLFVGDTGDGQSLTIYLDSVASAATPPDCS